MKITKLLLIGIIFISINAKSQTYFGMTFGGNMSYLTGDQKYANPTDKISPIKLLKPGARGGLTWDISSGYKTYIQISLLYSQEGSYYKLEEFRNLKDSVATEKYTYIRRNIVDYGKVPLIWKQVWGDWFTTLGIYGAFAIRADSKWTAIHAFSDTTVVKSDTYNSFVYDLRPVDMGLSFGVGVEFPLSNKVDFYIKLGYNHGMIALNPKETDNNLKMYNRCFSLSTGIIFFKKSYKIR